VALCLESDFIYVIPGVGGAALELDRGLGGLLQLAQCRQQLSRCELEELSLSFRADLDHGAHHVGIRLDRDQGRRIVYPMSMVSVWGA
jgi:hypothetical protein